MVALVALAAAEAWSEQLPVPYRHSYAVVIGVREYQSLDRAVGARDDAESVARTLTAQGFEVISLFDADATRQRISEVLGDELPSKLEAGDRVLVYFAGHGVTEGEGDASMGYLMPVDARSDKRRSTGLSMSELQAWFMDYRARHVLFVADACYSGLAIATRAIGLSPNVRDYIQQVSERPVRIALVAGTAGQEANPWRGKGLFTTFFLEAIEGAADANQDGVVTSDEVAAYVKPQVAQVAMSMGTTQNPQLGRRGEGEFLFFPTRRTGGLPGTALAAPAPERGTPVAVKFLPGALGVGAAVASAVCFANSNAIAQRLITRQPAFADQGEADRAAEEGKRLQLAGQLTAGVAVALVAASAVWLLWPSSEAPSAALVPIPGGAVATVGGVFP